MKRVLFSFLPWILFSILTGHSVHEFQLASIIALISIVICNRASLQHKILFEWATLIFLIAVLFISLINPQSWIVLHPWLISNLGLLAIALLSLAIKKPFTLQYAKMRVQKQAWQHPLFIKINYHLTIFWSALFAVNVLLNLERLFNANLNSAFYSWVSTLSMVIGALVTAKYPAWMRQRYRARAENPNHPHANPFLAGNYAPVKDELDIGNLQVIGKIPTDICGRYLRNGPNPEFEPISYHYPFDGDGMIHALDIKNGQARYYNKFVESEGLKLEREANKALFGSFLEPNPLPEEYAKRYPNNFKNGGFVHIIQHGKQNIAALEANLAYSMDDELNTIGYWHPEHKKPLPINAHYRIDPNTNHLYLMTYYTAQAKVTFYEIDQSNNLIAEFDVHKDHPTMIHDFFLTENYIGFIDAPAIYDVAQQPMLSWRPEIGTYLILISRKNPEQVLKIPSENFWVFHFANAYEEAGKLIFDYVHWQGLMDRSLPPMLYRASCDLQAKQVRLKKLSDYATEFPRFNERFTGKKYRYCYAPIAIIKQKFHALMQYDAKTDQSIVHDFGINCEVGEPIFIERAQSAHENDGYLGVYVYNIQTDSSEFVILDAAHLQSPPLARIKMPRRIPHGLHGSWKIS